MNTKINYIYRDADNYKVPNQCIIRGEMTGEQEKYIIGSLYAGQWFIPAQVGMSEKKFDTETEADHQWFEWQGIEPTDEKPTLDIDAEELIARFEKARHRFEFTNKAAGSVAFADLPALSENVLGNVYNITDAFITTDEFIEGAGNEYPEDTNVAVVKAGDAYKYSVLDLVDPTDFAESVGVVSGSVKMPHCVTIKETLSHTVIVWASERIEAEEIAEDLCNAGEISLGGNDFVERRCTCDGLATAGDLGEFEEYHSMH